MKIAFMAACIIGLVIHIYKFVNTLPNHDSLYNYYSDQNVIGSGRWLLSAACGISSYFDLPWVNGILSIIFIAVTSVFIVKIFGVDKPILIIIISGLLTSFPAITETFFFGYTADGYMIAMLLATLSVYFSRIGDKNPWHIIWAACCVCMACAIYQAYVSFALVLAVCYFMWELLNNKNTIKEYWHWVYKQIGIYISGLAVYFIVWKICLAFQNVQVNAYQGIDQIGQGGLSLFSEGIKNTVKSLLIFFLEWNVFEHGWTLYGVLNVLFLVIGAVAVFMAVIKSGLFKRHVSFGLFLLSIISIPFFCFIWYFVSLEVLYRPMMLQSICVIYIFIAIVVSSQLCIRLEKPVIFLLGLIIFNYGIQANICYFLLDKSYKATYAAGIEMISRLHLIDEDIEEIAVVGDILEEVSWETTDYGAKAHLLSSCLEQNLLFAREHLILFLNNTFNCSYSLVSTEQLEKLEKSDDVKQMGNWPEKDSMKVLGSTLIIKLSDPQSSESQN